MKIVNLYDETVEFLENHGYSIEEALYFFNKGFVFFNDIQELKRFDYDSEMYDNEIVALPNDVCVMLSDGKFLERRIEDIVDNNGSVTYREGWKLSDPKKKNRLIDPRSLMVIDVKLVNSVFGNLKVLHDVIKTAETSLNDNNISKDLLLLLISKCIGGDSFVNVYHMLCYKSGIVPIVSIERMYMHLCGTPLSSDFQRFSELVLEHVERYSGDEDEKLPDYEYRQLLFKYDDGFYKFVKMCDEDGSKFLSNLEKYLGDVCGSVSDDYISILCGLKSEKLYLPLAPSNDIDNSVNLDIKTISGDLNKWVRLRYDLREETTESLDTVIGEIKEILNKAKDISLEPINSGLYKGKIEVSEEFEVTISELNLPPITDFKLSVDDLVYHELICSDYEERHQFLQVVSKYVYKENSRLERKSLFDLMV